MFNNISSYKQEQMLPPQSLFSQKKITELMINELSQKGINTSLVDKSKTYSISELVDSLKLVNNLDTAYLTKLVNTARSYAFDSKYSTYPPDQDTRSLSPSWDHEFNIVKNFLCPDVLEKYRIINIGVASGIEAQHLFSKANNLTLVDVGTECLESCSKKLPSAKLVNNSADSLIDIVSASMDLYISLRTYNSAYFDPYVAIKEARRVLSNTGVIILSIANGFAGENNQIIKGLIKHGTNQVQIGRGYQLAAQVFQILVLNGFYQILLLEGSTEIYIGGKLNKNAA